MAETSEIRITLGRSGQVVKRPDSIPVKRSVRDRLGTAPPHLHNHNHKRSRVDDDDDDARFTNHFPDDLHLSKHDLRFKILKRTQTTTLDLRDMLSRPPRPKPHSLHRPTRIPHPRDLPHPHHLHDPPNHMPDQPQHRRRLPDSTDDAHTMPQPLQVRRHDIPKLNDTRHRIPHPTNASMTRHFTTSEGPSQMDYLRSSYSPWTLDHIRRKSPDLTTSRGLSPPPPRTEQTQRRPVIRPYEAPPKSVTYASREIPRPMTTTSFMPNPSLSVAPTKSVGTLVTAPLSSGGSMQRNQYPVAETLTVEGFLRSLGLEKYLISFKVEEVDMAALSQMGDHDLKEMGIPMGPRKKILLSLLARARGQAR